jgi:uncharacterized cofD-like protein
LQEELGILPPGDIRNCLVALADDEALVTDLFKYRFAEGQGLLGHSFGNLFLAAMTAVTGNFDRAIQESSHVLNIKGRVLPATLERVTLRATLVDGSEVMGETNISRSAAPIKSIALEPQGAQPVRDALRAIVEADAIILGPGSLYTSILPNLFVAGVARAIEEANAPKIYICNVMTQPGETVDYPASRHVEVLRSAGHVKVDYAIVNQELPQRLLETYAEGGQAPVEADREAVEATGARFVGARVISETATVRHDPRKLADVVIKLIDENIAERSSFVRLSTPSAPAPSPQLSTE